MKAAELVDGICGYVTAEVAPKMASPLTKFALGAMSSATGRRLMESRLAPMLAAVTGDDGEIDLAAAKDLVLSGLAASGPVPLLGGLLTADRSDAEALFARLGA